MSLGAPQDSVFRVISQQMEKSGSKAGREGAGVGIQLPRELVEPCVVVEKQLWGEGQQWCSSGVEHQGSVLGDFPHPAATTSQARAVVCQAGPWLQFCCLIDGRGQSN